MKLYDDKASCVLLLLVILDIFHLSVHMCVDYYVKALD